MNELRDFEDDLRAMFADVEAAATPSAGLNERLITTATRPPETVRRIHLRTRWLPPLLVAAAVVAMAVAAALIVSGSRSHHKQPPAHPSPTTTAPVAPVSVPGFKARNVSFRDPQHGYAIGNVPCNNKPKHCATLLRTDDGGATWVKLSVPKGITPVDDVGNVSGGSCITNGAIYGPCVDQVLFTDAEHGYLWSFHSVYWTTDGGKTWRDAHSRASEIVQLGNHVVRSRVLHDCSSGCAYHLEMSTIGSATWHNVTPVSALISVDLQAAHGIGYVTAVKSTSGPAAKYFLYRSTDGGATWHEVGGLAQTCALLNLAPDGTAVISCFVNGTETLHLLAPGANQAGPARQLPPGNWQATTVVAWSSEDLTAFLMPNENTITTPPQRAFTSNDGGASWQADGLGEGWQVIDSTHGYRLTSKPDNFILQVTNDRGVTFSTLRF